MEMAASVALLLRRPGRPMTLGSCSASARVGRQMLRGKSNWRNFERRRRRRAEATTATQQHEIASHLLKEMPMRVTTLPKSCFPPTSLLCFSMMIA